MPSTINTGLADTFYERSVRSSIFVHHNVMITEVVTYLVRNSDRFFRDNKFIAIIPRVKKIGVNIFSGL